MTAKERRLKLTDEINRLTSQYNALMCGRMLPTSRAIKLKSRIDDLVSIVNRIDREAAERVALEKAPIDEVIGVIAIPLLADVMNSIIAEVDGMLRRNGVQETVFGDYIRQIRRASKAMIDTLDKAEEGIPMLLDADDTLVEAIEKKLKGFIKQRLNIKK